MTATERPAERWLVVMERAYRGAVESQYADGLNFIQDLHRQSGACDLALRGAAVGYAVETGFEPSVRIGDRTLDTLPDPRAALTRMLADGMTILAERDGLDALGATARARLLPGVRVVTPGELAASWPSYTQVWFM